MNKVLRNRVLKILLTKRLENWLPASRAVKGEMKNKCSLIYTKVRLTTKLVKKGF